MRLYLRLVALCRLVIAASLIAGCSARVDVHAAPSPGPVDGKTVQDAIDRQLVPALVRQNTSIRVGPSSCPQEVHVDTPGARCSLNVSGEVLPIAVSRSSDGTLIVRPAAALFVIPDLERKSAALLAADYGARPQVRCDGPRVRIVAPGTDLRCALSRVPRLGARLSIRVDDAEGHVTLAPAAGARQTSVLAPYLANARGDRVVVPGAKLAAIVRARLLAVTEPGLTARFFGEARCPEPSVLTPGAPPTCTVRTKSGDLHVTVARSKNGIDVNPVEELVDTKHVADVATSFYQKKLAAAGFPGTAIVDCGARRLVLLGPESVVHCTITAGNTPPRAVLVRAGMHGALRFDVPPRPRT